MSRGQSTLPAGRTSSNLSLEVTLKEKTCFVTRCAREGGVEEQQRLKGAGRAERRAASATPGRRSWGFGFSSWTSSERGRGREQVLCVHRNRNTVFSTGRKIHAQDGNSGRGGELTRSHVEIQVTPSSRPSANSVTPGPLPVT